MESVGLHELCQNAAELLSRVEGGERTRIAVSGRPRALLVPAESRRLRSWAEVADVFDGPTDHDRDTERDSPDQQLRDPWVDRRRG